MRKINEVATNHEMLKYLNKGQNPLKAILNDAKKYGIDPKLIKQAEERGRVTGDFFVGYAEREKAYNEIKKIIKSEGEKANKDYLEILEQFPDDPNLTATAAFCLSPEIREKVGERLDVLYRAELEIGGRRRGTGDPLVRKRISHRRSERPDYMLAHNLEELIAGIPREEFTGDREYQRRLRNIIKKKVEKDTFYLFEENEENAFKKIDGFLTKTTNENLREVYINLKRTYEDYTNFQLGDANLNFKDPETGERGVLPSLAQRIDVYNFMKEKKYGLFSGCGTGKTATAILAQPLIKKELESQGKEFKRTVIVCRNSSKKAWKNGLMGNEDERYFKKAVDKNKIAIIDSDTKKDDEFMESLKDKEWIILNYEQPTTEVNGGRQLFAEALVNLGIDYTIFDEAHHIKEKRKETHSGKPTISAAARYIAHSSEHLVLLTASPMPDTPGDYAVPFHLLMPQICPNPEDFDKLYEGNPRVLNTFFTEKTVRRTLEEINDLDLKEIKTDVEIDPVQKKIYEYILEKRPRNWLIEARKSLLDPRLVDPEILKKLDLVGKVSVKNSSKYKRLEEILVGDESPVRSGEKFVIFSSMFRDGITRKEHKTLENKYKRLGLEKEYEALSFDESLAERMERILRKEYGMDLKIGVIDGKVGDIEEREKITEGLKDGLAGILCTTDTGGESLDFSAASHGYFLDEDYSPKTTDQARGRLLRKGQKREVKIGYFRCRGTLDEQVRDYVEKKRIIIKIASDGYPLTSDEIEFLKDIKGKRLVQLIKKGLGGTSIDVLKAGIENVYDFNTKKRIKKSSGSPRFNEISYETTDAQKIMRWIAQDTNCWKNPEFVDLYIKTLRGLSVPVIHRAKICDLIGRVKQEQINFPKTILSEGAGPSLLYDAYQNLNRIVEKNGFRLPMIVDRDTSRLMLTYGENPNRIVGCMTGKDSVFQKESFDMVDNESISLLKDPEEIKSCLVEANRILKQNGVLELIVKNTGFADSFYSGVEKAGFKILSRKDEGFFAEKDFLKRLKIKYGAHYAEAYSNKLANTYLLLAEKKDKPTKVDAELFRFKRLNIPQDTDDEMEQEKATEEGKSKTEKEIKGKFRAKRKLTVDKFGNVISVKNLQGEN